MELKIYLDILMRRWRTALQIAVVVTFVAVLVTIINPTNYQAKTLLRVVTPSGGSLTGPAYQYAYADRLLNTYVQIATSAQVKKQLEEKLGLSEVPDIDVSVISNSEIIQIRAKSKDPALASLTTNTLAEILVSLQNTTTTVDSNELSAFAARKDEYETKLSQAQNEYDRLVQAYSETTAQTTVLERSIQTKTAAYQNLTTRYEQAFVEEAVSPSGTNRLAIEALTQEMDRIKKEIDALNLQDQKLLTDSSQYLQQITLTRSSIGTTQNAYSEFLQLYDSALTASQRQNGTSDVKIVSPAFGPLEPYGINRWLIIALELIMGMMFGIASVFILENMEDEGPAETISPEESPIDNPKMGRRPTDALATAGAKKN